MKVQMKRLIGRYSYLTLPNSTLLNSTFPNSTLPNFTFYPISVFTASAFITSEFTAFMEYSWRRGLRTGVGERYWRREVTISDKIIRAG